MGEILQIIQHYAYEKREIERDREKEREGERARVGERVRVRGRPKRR